MASVLRAGLFAIPATLVAASAAHAGNWLENWGALVWGSSLSVPALGESGLLVLGLSIGIVGGVLAARGQRAAASLCLVALVFLSPVAFRAVTVPNIFTNGTTADADEVNANFSTLAGAITALEGGSTDLQFGSGAGCTDASAGDFWRIVRFGSPMSAVPIFHGTMEDVNSAGATWSRLGSKRSTRVNVRCQGIADGFDWIAITPGIHVIDGKNVQAGRVANVMNGDAVFFAQLFASPPVVLIYIDETDNSGGTLVRLINDVTTGGFEVWLNSQVDFLNYIAMDPGTYNFGNLTWEAGVRTGGCNTNCVINWANPLPHEPNLLLTIQDIDNSGATWIRREGTSTTDGSVNLDGDSETIHYVAFTRQ